MSFGFPLSGMPSLAPVLAGLGIGLGSRMASQTNQMAPSHLPSLSNAGLGGQAATVIAGAAAGAALAWLYGNGRYKVKKEIIGPRDWSPRTGKCLCRRAH